MSQLVRTFQSEVGQMSEYDLDGMQLFFDPNRKVRASQSALARMCKVSEYTIRNRVSEPIVVNDPKCTVIQATTQSTGGGKRSSLHNSRTIRILLKEFNPDLLEQFEDFGVDEGLAQMCGVPLPAAAPQLSSEDQLILMATEAINMAYVRKTALVNPGDKRQLDQTLENKGNTLDGNMTVAEMAESRGITLTTDEARAVGVMLSGAVKCRKEEKTITKVERKYKDANGHHQKTKVNAYPVSMLSNFVSACVAMGKV